MTGSSRAGVIGKILKNKGRGWFAVFLDKNCIVHKVLGTGASVTGSAEYGIYAPNPVFELLDPVFFELRN